MLKRLLSSLLLAILLLGLASGVAYGFLYRAPIAITENASTSYVMLPVLWNQNNAWLATNGFMNSTANDTRVQTLGGLNKPWMVADNKTLTAIPVPAGSQTNLYFVTGESAASAMDIIVGYGGNVTIPYDATMDLGDSGNITFTDTYVDMSQVGSNLAYSPSSSRTWISGSSNLTSAILQSPAWYTANYTIDSGAAWANDNNAVDNNTATFATSTSETDYLELNLITPAYSDKVRIYANDSGGGANPTTSIDIYYSGSWHNIQNGIGTANTWVEYAFVKQLISAMRVKFTANLDHALGELQYWGYDIPAISVTYNSMTSDEYDITTAIDTVNMTLYIDGLPVATTPLGAIVVPVSGNDWYLMQGNSLSYMGSYTHTAGGNITQYQPSATISGVTLPDEVGTNDGVITWGANPAGVGAILGSMSSSGQPSIGGASDTSTRDILPPVGGTDWRPDAGVSATLQANPMRSIVTAISDNTTLSEYQVWVWFGIIFVVFITVLVGSRVNGHHLITGIAASAAIIMMIAWTVFPLLSLLVVVLAIWGGLISERSHSL